MEKVGTICTLRGKNQIPMKQIPAGDIGVISRLQFTMTGDTLSAKETPVQFAPIEYPLPMYSRAIAPKKKGDEDKIASALNKLMDEDPTFIVSRNPVTKETLISGMGDQHLDILMERMKRKFGVDAVLKPPMVEYRETIRGFCGSGRQITKNRPAATGSTAMWSSRWNPCLRDPGSCSRTRSLAAPCPGSISRQWKRA